MRRASPLRLLLSAFLLHSAIAAHAQVVDPNLWVTNGKVSATLLDGARLYVGGQFSYVGPQTGSFTSYDWIDQHLKTRWPRVDGTVLCAAPDGAGGWYIGGTFTKVGGFTRNNVAHIDAGGGTVQWNPNPNGAVRSILVRGRKVYVAGDFTTISSTPRNRAACLDAVYGTPQAWNPNASGAVNTIVALDDKIFAGGSFTTIGGQARNRIAALDTLNGAATAWNPNANAAVFAVFATPSRVYVGGDFTNVGGQNRSRVAALGTASGLALGWNPGANGRVLALAMRSPHLYVGGGFDVASGVTRHGIAALDTINGAATTWNPGWNGSVNAIAFDEMHTYLGGSFTYMSGVRRENFAVVTAGGTGTALAPDVPAGGEVFVVAPGPRETFVGGAFASFGGVLRDNLAALDVASGEALPFAPNPNDAVLAMSRAAGWLYAAGPFSFIGGASRFFVARVDTTAGLASTWNPNPDSLVRCIHATPGAVYVGGHFLNIGGAARNRLATLNVSTGAPTTFNASVTTANAGPDVYTYVSALTVRNNALYFGGRFNRVNGVYRQYLASVDLLNGALNTWNPQSTGVPITQITYGDQRIYVSGAFPEVIGSRPANFMIADTLGSGVYPTNYFADSLVSAFAVANSKVYLAGGFHYLENSVRDGLGSCNYFSTLPTSWAPMPDTRVVNAIALEGENVYAGGAFTRMGAAPCKGLAKLLPTPAGLPTVTVLKPNGGEIINQISTYHVTWTASAPYPGVQSLDLYISYTGAAGPWVLYASGLPNTGSYDLYLPSPGQWPTNCYLRLDARDWAGQIGTDRSNGPWTIGNAITTGADDAALAAFAMDPIAPNPARGATPVRFALPHRADVRVSVLDVQGREIAVLADGAFEAGRHAVTLDGARLSPGLFFVRVQSGGVSLARRVAIVR
ncbi:MAG: T9SS type A sorting domain-containing protein [Candidatus Eisenbacteria bacterium]|uniref:T9SS type A sorting domain-containing protein n=1 Tax=Eiseniibacteriota bacterium TaxID=2212470 RepID=A0A933WBQ3_UNCEI|nr:T9SS type A sorting domain-containing protein [Candidatus Eisenbacteria bacterium]